MLGGNERGSDGPADKEGLQHFVHSTSMQCQGITTKPDCVQRRAGYVYEMTLFPPEYIQERLTGKEIQLSDVLFTASLLLKKGNKGIRHFGCIALLALQLALPALEIAPYIGM